MRRLAARAQIAPFELSIAILLVLSGVRFLWKPAELDASQIGQTLPAPELWALGYLVAGLLVVVGVLAPFAKMEAAGLSLMASVVAINAIAFVYAYDFWSQWQYGVALVFYATLALAALARLRVLISGPAILLHAQPPHRHDDS